MNHKIVSQSEKFVLNRQVSLKLRRVRLLFERIIQITVFASQPKPQAATQIRGDEKQAPALDLADVDSFVVAGAFEAFEVASDHDVSQRHGRSSTRQRNQSFQNPANKSSMQFEHTGDKLQTASRQQCGRHEQQAHASGGRGPEIFEDRQQCFHPQKKPHP